MGTLLDSTVLIDMERRARELPPPQAMGVMVARLERELGAEDEVAIAAITASELLHGVHRASSEYRGRREAFVETVLAAFPTVPFDLLCARAHARLWAELLLTGTDIGPHDRMIAATALAGGWRVATANVRHYAHIAGITVIDPDLSV